MTKKQERLQRPTGTLEERIEHLLKGLSTEGFNALAGFDREFFLQDPVEHLVSTLEQLEAYRKNGNSTEGLWFEHGRAVTCF